MAVNAGILKVVVSFYRIDSETAHKRHRSCIPINNVNTVLELKKHLILFLGLQELSSKSPCLSSCNDSTRSTKTIVHPSANFSRWIRKLEACPGSPSFIKANFSLRCKWRHSVVCRRCPERNYTSDITLQWSWHCWYRTQTRDLPD